MHKIRSDAPLFATRFKAAEMLVSGSQDRSYCTAGHVLRVSMLYISKSPRTCSADRKSSVIQQTVQRRDPMTRESLRQLATGAGGWPRQARVLVNRAGQGWI